MKQRTLYIDKRVHLKYMIINIYTPNGWTQNTWDHDIMEGKKKNSIIIIGNFYIPRSVIEFP